jgi:formiminotetrahydrofolate cyclodeaminase
LNVKINAAGIKDREFAEKMVKAGAEIEAKAMQKEAELLVRVNEIINK